MATGARAAALALLAKQEDSAKQPTGARALALKTVEEGVQMGNPLYSRTMLGAVTRIGANAAKFGVRLGLPTEGISETLSDAAEAIEPAPEQGLAADVARGVASLPVFPLAFLSEGEQAAKAAEEHGATPGQALAIGSGVGVVSGALEALLPLGVGKVLTKGAKTGLRAIATNLLKGSAVEGGTEAAQQVLQNAVPAAYEGDPSGLLEGVPRSAAVGAIVGGGVAAPATAVAGRAPAASPDGTGAPVAEPVVPADVPGAEAATEAVSTPEASLAAEGVSPAPSALVPPEGAPATAGQEQGAPVPGASAGAGVNLLRRGGPLTTPLIDRVERQGGAVGQQIATLARDASDVAGELRGKWQVATRDFRAALRGFTPTQRRVRNELNQRDEVAAEDTSGPLASYGFARFQQAAENDDVLATLSPEARSEVERFREFMQSSARDVEALTTPEGGPVLMETSRGKVPFRGAEGGKRLIRQWTPELWQIMQAGDQSQAYRALAQALGEANGMNGEVALRTLNGIRESVVERRSAAEVARQFKEFPTFMRLRDGTEVPLLLADPMQATASVVNNLALRMGYVTQFGQDSPNKSLGDRLREDFVRAGGEQADVDNVMRALQGIPVDDPSATLRPGTPAYEAMRVADAARTIGNASLLTRAFVPNVPESLSKTPVVGGIKRSLKAYRDMGRMLVDPTFRKEAVADIERRGWHTIDMIDLMLTPGRKLESAARMVASVLHLPATKVNELNDMHAAMTARSMLRDLEAGRGKPMDVVRLELLQFTPAQIRTIMAGNPTPETAPLFNAVGRRLVSYSQGSTSMPAELSRAANSRGYQRVVAFDRYAQFTANRLIRQVQAVASAKDAASRTRHAALLGQSIAGHALSGTGAVLLGSLLKDGIVGLKDTARGAVAGDEPEEKVAAFWEFIKDVAAYAMFGGAVDTIYESLTSPSSGEMAKRFVSGTIPGRYVAEFVDWYNGAGRYKAKSSSEAALGFLERNLPIAPIVRQAVAEMGLGGKDPQREVAIRRAWEFIRKNQGVGSSGVPTDPADADGLAEALKFGIAMKRVESALRRGDTKALPKLRAEAMKAGVKAGKSPSKSLAGRTIISKIHKDKRAAAREFMGEENWKALERYDALLKMAM